ncbi:Ribosomal RNA-processing protein 8 [Habropoda laboriosa]|uniref:Ribosomal RNA-processing protein 8 n=1 Tax=Habropoda laboriosa TaxID=597456 RepID=A0A0L7RFK7_9HYME|nr:PREDICTED: ribosomal RNA-processing protein 8 [Habropoda laboriosa]KOC69609.1 Ribosomal RNA-processing protein 8 [Habropoda laboriosa]
MAKKTKKSSSKAKNVNKNVNKKNISQETQLEDDYENKRKPPKVKDRNLKFKSKSKSKNNNLAKKIKQIHKNEENRTSVNIVKSDTVKLINTKKKGQRKTVEFQVENERKQQLGKQKQNQNQNKTSNQSNNKAIKNEISVKKKKSKIEKLKIKQKQKVDNETQKPSSVSKKKQKQTKPEKPNSIPEKNQKRDKALSHHNLDVKRLEDLLVAKRREKKLEKKNEKPPTLRERMMVKLKASRFRYLNETLYNNDSSESKKYFKDDPEAFKAYHEGYKQQIDQWPLNPLDNIISSIKKMPKEHIIADFGCGEARLAASVSHKVHSFDFVSLNENVTVCDMAHTPLLTNGVHVVVFCLSLMGTNLSDYIIEANRVLKKDGILKIAEVESRFDRVEDFIKAVTSYGFKSTWQDLSHNLFYFLDFKKETDIGGKRNKLPPITLKPCLYKKR